jgi:hypothetical protein
MRCLSLRFMWIVISKAFVIEEKRDQMPSLSHIFIFYLGNHNINVIYYRVAYPVTISYIIVDGGFLN